MAGPAHPADAVALHDSHPLSQSESSQHPLSSANDRLEETQVPPQHAVSALPAWNQNKANVFKTLSTFVAFIIMGANDAAYGAIIPYLEEYYSITYIVVSLVFLSPLVGYIASAALNNLIHVHFGQRGVALIGPTCHLIAYVVIALHPPYPVLVFVIILAGFGNGLLDAGWNAHVGNLAHANQVLGFLHGFYGMGAVLSPLIATTMVTRSGFQWYAFYYIMIGAAGVELATSVASFWRETGHKFRSMNTTDNSRNKGATREALKRRVTWVSAIFLLIYVGIEVALGGWIVTYMIRVRNGDPFAAGLSATGFWLGITAGRVILGFITERVGENLSIILYLLGAIICQLLFWLVPSFIGGSIAVAFVGFFLGPLFPAAVVALTKLLPSHMHVPAIGFSAAFGGGGACVLPFGVGAIAQSAGVQVLQPVIMAMLVLATLLWAIGMPRIKKEGDNDKMGRMTAAGKKAGRKISRICAALV